MRHDSADARRWRQVTILRLCLGSMTTSVLLLLHSDHVNLGLLD